MFGNATQAVYGFLAQFARRTHLLGVGSYVYNPATGQREIEPFQTEIMRRIFRRFAETRSFSAVSNELNDDLERRRAEGAVTELREAWAPTNYEGPRAAAVRPSSHADGVAGQPSAPPALRLGPSA